MKNIKLLSSIFALLLLASCEDYNLKNFPNYAELQRPDNLAIYTYELTSTDFATIGDDVKRSIETAITAEQARLTAKLAELKTAKTAADSLRINAEHTALKLLVDAEIAQLRLRPEFVAGMFLRTNRFFNETYTAADWVSNFLNNKYRFADVGSSVQLTYKYASAADTVGITAANKYTMVTDDYNALGEADNMPGRNDNFSATINPDVFIPRLLAVKFPLANKDDIKMVRYMFFVSPQARMTYSLFQFNGTNWKAYSRTEQFVFADTHTWIFDPTITLTLARADYELLMPYIFEHNGKPLSVLEGYNEWTSNDTVRFIFNPRFPPASSTDFTNVRTEFFFGSSWHFLNFDVRITSRTYTEDFQLQKHFAEIDANTALDSDAKRAAKTAFMEKRVVQGMALLLAIKYPTLEPKVKGVNQHVKLNVQLFDGARWFWTYNFQCVEKGKFKYIERTKWK